MDTQQTRHAGTTADNGLSPAPEWIDRDGDKLSAHDLRDGSRLSLMATGREGRSTAVHLDRGQALELYHWLGERLMATEEAAQPASALPDATEDGYDWPEEPLAAWERELLEPETIAEEAHRMVHGDRETDYGHPREDFTRQAILWTALLHHKLADGEYIEAEDIARCMVAVKLARDVHSPKRDNRVDGAGYFIALDRLRTGE